MSDELRAWLSEELRRRKWSHGELARQSGVSRPFISQVLAGDVSASVNFCHKIAEALGVAPEKMLRLAGILPAESSDDSTLAELIELARALPPEKRQQALDYLDYLFKKS